VEKDKCYGIEWSTNATLSHTTVEVRDAASGEMVSFKIFSRTFYQCQRKERGWHMRWEERGKGRDTRSRRGKRIWANIMALGLLPRYKWRMDS
jgi:hypothetical protein